jgi:hypothetical protein
MPKYNLIHKPITKELNLSEFDENQDFVFHVWVNLPMKMIRRRNKLTIESLEALRETETIANRINETAKETDKAKKAAQVVKNAAAKKLVEARVKKANRAEAEFFTEIWSQGEDEETHWTVDDFQEWQKELTEENPGLWRWVLRATNALINTHREGYLKN